MKAMGIDIGTTTISLVLIDGESGKLLAARTAPSGSFLRGGSPGARIQSAEDIWRRVKQELDILCAEAGKPDAIGLTGQMHGMVYVNRNGEAVSPFYTWQDSRGDELLKSGRSSAEILREAAGAASSGYGLTTHYYLMQRREVPDDAFRMSTISDYIGMRLCKEKEPAIARDMAASWGCFDVEIGDFCRDELENLGVNTDLLPHVLSNHPVTGRTCLPFLKGVPVTVSLGDNQASVLGSVKDPASSVLINVGTGSQISVCTSHFTDASGSIELRPFNDSLFLLAGSGLCGGRAYAMLENFFHDIIKAGLYDESIASGYRDAGKAGDQRRTEDASCYQVMEQLARDFAGTYGREAAWKIRTTFSGTRNDPKERGSISSIGVENFHPGAMVLGMIGGILGELYEMYQQMCAMTGETAAQLVGSGNAFRKNGLMREIAEELFRMPVMIPAYREEAAIGAALQSLVSSGYYRSQEDMQRRIRYEGETSRK